MHKLLPLLLLTLCAFAAHAQGNYELQVYGAGTVAPKTLMVELHSNYTIEGQKNTIDGVYPTNHQLHETLELTQGINTWPEIGFSAFPSGKAAPGSQWEGTITRRGGWSPDSGHGPSASASPPRS